MITRDRALRILHEYTKSESLRRHALQVETCVAACASRLGQDEETWRVTGLLHDFDYEIHPEAPDHPMKGEAILTGQGVPPEIRRAVLSHAGYSGVSRDSPLEKTLFACDELSGFISARALVKPSRKVAEVDVKSVRKKLKDKAFARSVSRDDIVNGAAETGVDLDEHIGFCIQAMQGNADAIGL
jgi:putative nucleotidyltransferase with HDIG domain